MFSIKQLMLFIAVVAAAMMISRYLQAAMALLVCAICALAALPFFPDSKRRSFVYGAVAGVVVGLIAVGVYLQYSFASFNAIHRRPDPARATFEDFAPYAVSIGMVVGATGGLLVSFKAGKSNVAGRR